MVQIYGTLGPACSDTETLARLFEAGMTGIRLNLSHVGLPGAAEQLEHLRAAARRCGVSRSAYYKYKDAIRPFQDMVHGRIVTIQILLRNQPGALSSVLNLLADRGGNVLTINQAIPGGGAAAVTVGLETSGLSAGLEELLSELGARPEVIRCEVPAG